jgi:monovalent cation/hydrogen antiporter
MDTTSLVLVMLLAVVASRLIARLTQLPVPLIQIALGAAIFYTGFASVEMDPEVFFVLLLPPLLFLDGWRIPKDDLFREAPHVLRLSMGLVLFTVLGVGLLIHWVIPAIPLAVAFALAAVISPTDPVALAAITASTPIPQRMRHILEGESLFNDASGLVCMRFAVAATLTGAFSLPEALASFAWVAIGGLAIGFAVTWLVTHANSGRTALLGDDGAAQILITLLIPSGVYLLAEMLQCSGILAAVAAGITMSFMPRSHWQAITRIRRTAVWDTVQFAANGCIFVLLGEQIPSILASSAHTVRLTGHQNPWWLGLYVLGIVTALGVLRFVWVWVSMRGTFKRATNAQQPTAPGYARLVLAMSLAGVRGAITLAGVLTLPLKLGNGAPFPARDLAIFLAAGVIVLSLVLAAIALPRTLRGLEAPLDPSLRDAENRLRTAGALAAIAAIKSECADLDGVSNEPSNHAEICARLVALYQSRIEQFSADEDGVIPPEKTDALERQLRLAGLQAERTEVIRFASAEAVKDLSLRKIIREIDLHEARHSDPV